jgi:hypothetical protein
VKAEGHGNNGQQQHEQQQQEQLPIADPHGLRDARRPYNALSGCNVCWRGGDSQRLLLCDGCEDEYHCYCVTPALLEVPEGDWYCHLCMGGRGSSRSRSKAVQPPVPAGTGAGSWDMEAAAQLPETCTAAASNSSSSMHYVKQLVGVAQQLGSVAYGAWPAEARLQLLLLLCELLVGSNEGRAFLEARLEDKRDAKKRVRVACVHGGGVA